jgi:Protein of unknown function (DUF3592)
LLLGAATVLAVSTADFERKAQRTDGVVIDLRDPPGLSSSWAVHPVVTYVSPVDGRQYTFQDETGSRPPAYAIGERVPVLYDPDQPGDARIDSLANRALGPAICGGIGAVFTALGFVFLIRARRRAKHVAWLRVSGRERWVEVDHIDQDSGIRLNGRCPFVVHASWVDEQTGRTHTARSEHLWQHPGPDLMAQRVRVLFDPADPDRNLIDLSSRPSRHP